MYTKLTSRSCNTCSIKKLYPKTHVLNRGEKFLLLGFNKCFYYLVFNKSLGNPEYSKTTCPKLHHWTVTGKINEQRGNIWMEKTKLWTADEFCFPGFKQAWPTAHRAESTNRVKFTLCLYSKQTMKVNVIQKLFGQIRYGWNPFDNSTSLMARKLGFLS